MENCVGENIKKLKVEGASGEGDGRGDVQYFQTAQGDLKIDLRTDPSFPSQGGGKMGWIR